jgi:ABC-type uncharacterized transport system substrate-binding protein
LPSACRDTPSALPIVTHRTLRTRNVRIDERWGVGDTEVIRAAALELLQLNPNVIIAQGARAVPILQQATKTIPIVFVSISDPVGRGIVTSMARPGRQYHWISTL